MRPYPLLTGLFVSLLLTVGLSCNRPDENDAQPTVCRLTSVTDQLIETSGRLTDEMQRTFTYTNDELASIAERSQNQEVVFQLEYTDKRAVRAANEQNGLVFSYPSTGTLPNSATFTQGRSISSTFTMEYTPASRLSRVVERRLVLPANSLTTERAYTFTYDNAGNLTTERGKFTLRTGPVVETETEYTPDTKPSPYASFPERSVLTIMALSQAVETMPGRFWHLNAPASYKSYILNSVGERGPLSESATFAPTYDATNKLMSQDQTALLYQSSVQAPITKKNRQAFVYECE